MRVVSNFVASLSATLRTEEMIGGSWRCRIRVFWTSRSREPRSRKTTSYLQTANTSAETQWQRTLRVSTGFFVAGRGKPAHLVRLILRAGDVEENPGPPLPCGYCKKRVGGGSIRCTWCLQWIHQKCSGLTRQEMADMRRNERYAYECPTVSHRGSPQSRKSL